MTTGDPLPPPPPPPEQPTASPGRPNWMPFAVIGAILVAVIVVAFVALGGDEERAPDPTTAAGSSSTTTTSTTVADTTSTTAAAAATTTTTTAPTTTTTTMPAALEPGGTWTLLVYMLGDNNLESALFPDIEEMSFLPESDDLTVLALVDRHDDYSTREMLNIPDWTGTKLFRVEPGRLEELADYGEANLGDPAVLRDFLVTGIQTAPADHYALVLWDHGAIVGIGEDEAPGDGLDPREIAQALDEGLTTAGVPMLDIIGFDACMMGAYELASVMAPHAYYMIGSEENEPNGGWNYEAFDHVALNPERTAESLGREILRRFVALEAQGSPDVTLSLVELPHIDELNTALAAFTDAAAAGMDRYAAAIARERLATMSFAGNPDPSLDWFMVDLGDFMERLAGAVPELAGPIGEVTTALDNAVVDVGTGTVHQGASGLAVHFPPRPDYWRPAFAPLLPEPWLDFIQAFYDAGGEIPQNQQPDITDAQNLAQYVLDDDGLSVEADFNLAAQDTAVEVILYNGIPEADGSVTYYGETGGSIEGTTAFGFYDLGMLLLDDGEDQAFAYQDLSFSEDFTAVTLDVPFAYFPPGSDEWLDTVISVVYEPATDTYSETMYQIDAEGYWGVFDPDPTGLLKPWVLRVYPDGTAQWEPSTEVGLWADLIALQWDWVTLEPGTPLYAELWVCDFGGNCDFASVDTVVGSGGGTADRQFCRNTTLGFEFAHPTWLESWSAIDPYRACESLNDVPFTGTTDDEAYAEAVLTVEVLSDAALTDMEGLINDNATSVQQVNLPGFDLPATYAVSDVPGAEFTAYIIPLDVGGPAFVIVGWEYLSPGAALPEAVEMVVNTLAGLQ